MSRCLTPDPSHKLVCVFVFQNKVEEVMEAFSPAADGLYTYSRSLSDESTLEHTDFESEAKIQQQGRENRERKLQKSKLT